MDVTERNKIQMYGSLVLLGLFHLSLHVTFFMALSYQYRIFEANLSLLLK